MKIKKTQISNQRESKIIFSKKKRKKNYSYLTVSRRCAVSKNLSFPFKFQSNIKTVMDEISLTILHPCYFSSRVSVTMKRLIFKKDVLRWTFIHDCFQIPHPFLSFFSHRITCTLLVHAEVPEIEIYRRPSVKQTGRAGEEGNLHTHSMSFIPIVSSIFRRNLNR